MNKKKQLRSQKRMDKKNMQMNTYGMKTQHSTKNQNP